MSWQHHRYGSVASGENDGIYRHLMATCWKSIGSDGDEGIPVKTGNRKR